MPYKIIFEGKVSSLQILDEFGNIDENLMLNLKSDGFLNLYKQMVIVRVFDDKALKLQRQGRMGTWASTYGQEAIQVGVPFALDKNDWIVPSFRESGVMLCFGVPGELIYYFWRGSERGSLWDEKIRCLPPSVPVGSQFLHSAGLGYAIKLKNEENIVVGFGGDGASSEGDFHEALNFATVFGSQTLFFVENNQWAISTPYKKQTNSRSIAQKGLAFEIDSLQVDGNDIFAVIIGTKIAREKILKEKKPYLIEGLTYRLSDHTTADDAKRYRSEEEVKERLKKEPLKRFSLFLKKLNILNEKLEKEIEEEAKKEVEGYVEKMENFPKPNPEEMLQFMYKEMTWNLKEQEKLLLEEKENA